MNISVSGLLLSLLLFSTAAATGEELPSEADKQFGILKEHYEKGRLTKESYLEKADSLLITFFSGGTYFERHELERLLSLFKDIAWSENEFATNRINYFEHFMNNALMQSKGGEAIYFSEKVSREITGDPDQKSLVELFTKCMFYIRNKNYTKAIELYKQEMKNIEAYPELLRSGKVSADEGIKLLHLLSIIITPYTELRDTTGVGHTVNTAENLAKELLPLVQDDKDKPFMVNLLVLSMHFFQDIFLKDYPGAKTRLDSARSLLDNKKELPEYIRAPAEYNLLEWWILYYLEIKDNENAAAYLERYAGSPSISTDHSSMINSFRARLKANEGHFREAYDIMVATGKEKDNLYANMMNELDQLLYSHTESEMSQAALRQAEAEKKKQTIWIFVIAAAAVITVILVSLWILREKKKSRAIITSLNNEANLQIAILEEEKRQASRKEQERIGLELHDNLSASMAAMLYQIEHIISETPPGDSRAELSGVRNVVEQVYQSVRSKSHRLHNGSGNADGDYFREQVEKMTTALPEGRFVKEIEIDPGAVTHLNLDQRVEILRIIQESVTNILKHARASVVNIFLYKKNRETVLHISDNGKGFDPGKVKNKTGLGLKSLAERAARLSGKLEISSGKDGTVIEVILAG